ncbi:MAG: RidA family protein [Rhodospirillales bacterium]|jgi:enamine deaminase RidA (YjgF/YER057c/UK114 family)|nr:RidA family protein [Rhodospirillales bacterium]MBT4626401.1 RidA family protein [Rhodospirillales bacterium]MBT5351125.1 RidA family protein [Rhodospirillales bacterium]MBT6109088.1 RidA family protein [Rhodospirillales bacterium]MBT7145587.1 RidA family protein [Rhodospirillales bacterium]
MIESRVTLEIFEGSLPVPPQPVGSYRPTRIQGSLLYVSNADASTENLPLPQGVVGGGVTTTEAVDHARRCGINLLAAVKSAVGSLRRVEQIVSLKGTICAVPQFTEHDLVLDGCSDLFVQLFGDQGLHTRTVFGVSTLPGNTTVEVEGVFKIRESNA